MLVWEAGEAEMCEDDKDIISELTVRRAILSACKMAKRMC